MRDIGLTAYSLLVIWVTGFLLIRRLGLFRGQFPSFVYGAALGIGGGALSLVLLVTSGVTGRLHLIYGYLLFLGAAVPSAWPAREAKRGPIVSSVKRRVSISELCLLGVLASIVLAMIVSGTFGTLARDGWAVWAFKAKVFFLSRQVDLAFLMDDPRFGFAHLDYPLLLPLVEWWVYSHLGHVNDSVVRLVHVGYYLSLLAAFYGSLRAYIGRTVVTLCTLLLALLGPAVVNTLDGYADLIQGYYVFLAFVSFVDWIHGGRAGELASAGVSLSLGAHVKTEGLSWLAAMTAVVVLGAWLARKEWSTRGKALLVFLAITVPVSGMWLLYRWVFHIPLSPITRWLTFDLVAARLPLIVGAFQTEFGVRALWQQGWGLLWAFTLLGCLGALATRSPSRWRTLWYWSPLLLQGLIVLGFYLLTAAPLKWHLETSLTRVLLQYAPCGLWASAATLLPGEPFKLHRRRDYARPE